MVGCCRRPMILKKLTENALLFFGGEVHAKNGPCNFFGGRKFDASLGVAQSPRKFTGGQFLEECHNSKSAWPRKPILHSNDAK